MALYAINIGSAPNDTTGDTLRIAMNKINENFTKVPEFQPDGSIIFPNGALIQAQSVAGTTSSPLVTPLVASQSTNGTNVVGVYTETYLGTRYGNSLIFKTTHTGGALLEAGRFDENQNLLLTANVKLNVGSDVYPTENWDVCFSATANNVLQITMKGGDGVVRSTTMTLT